MRPEHSYQEEEKLFTDAVDGRLLTEGDAKWRALLDSSGEVKARFDRYQKTVARLKAAPKPKAPPVLAGIILRRVRRRRSLSRLEATAQVDYRVPVEAFIPVLLACAVAAYFYLAA